MTHDPGRGGWLQNIIHVHVRNENHNSNSRGLGCLGALLALLLMPLLCWGGCAMFFDAATHVAVNPPTRTPPLRSVPPPQPRPNVQPQRAADPPIQRAAVLPAINLDDEPLAKPEQAPRKFEGRTWTIETTGQTLEARLVKSGGGKATLETEAGERIVLPLEELSQEDREWIHKAALKR